ncbi:MAG: glycosyl hydrolase family 28-related protein [Acidobacteriota bacterium]
MMLATAVLVAAQAVAPAPGASYYPVRLDDPGAVYLVPEEFPVRGDGVADDTAAVQQAIDRVEETSKQGIVFVPEGRYRLTSTVYVWPGIRLIGYGPSRPAFVLGPDTPGYQDEDAERYMVFFAGRRPRDGSPPRDANPGTFYSAMSNIDVEIGPGNPGAVGVRGRYAQHSFLAHMELRIGSGLAGVHDTGNVMEDVRFVGGRYGLWTQRPSPGWQLTLVDVSFEGQREAAIREREAGLTLVRPQFRSVPTAIEIEAGRSDQLWVKDGWMEDVTGPAVVISNEKNARTQINVENLVCRNVPVFAVLRESGRKYEGTGTAYRVRTFSYGLHFDDLGAVPETRDVIDVAPLASLPPPVPTDLRELPPADTWVNLRSLGARGDASTDDTEAIRAAIAAHRAIYVPSGHYVVADTITLRPDTVLIGLHPSTTMLVLPDETPAFQGVGSPKPLLEAPEGGTNVVVGLGLYTNGKNPRAVGARWRAGAESMMNDVRFHGGHGTNRPDGSRERPYNNTHTADPDLARRWDGQYPSLWVTEGGGGTFFDIWTPSTFAQAGLLVSDTTTPGHVYSMSIEHHVRHEVQLHRVSNWELYALQTEEERGEGGAALPLEIVDSTDITVANLLMYRVISTYQPFPWGVEVVRSRDVRFRGVHSYSNSKVSFDSTIHDPVHGVEVRERELAWLDVSGRPPQERTRATSEVLADGARVERLAGGFYNISGGAVAPSGDFYFVDAHRQRIHRWSVAEGQVSTVRDNPLDPVNLAFDASGNLLVVSYSGKGTIYSFRPEAPGLDIALVSPEPATARPGLLAVFPTSDWRIDREALAHPARHYLSPDGTVFVPASEGFVTGATSWGVKSSGLIRSFGLAPAAAGQPVYITDESDQTTWVGVAQPDGSVSHLRLFAHRGGEGVAVDLRGYVYIAAGQIHVYDPAGRFVETIEVPERPLQLVFGGPDGRTLFIPARTSLYAVRTRHFGRRVFRLAAAP